MHFCTKYFYYTRIYIEDFRVVMACSRLYISHLVDKMHTSCLHTPEGHNLNCQSGEQLTFNFKYITIPITKMHKVKTFKLRIHEQFKSNNEHWEQKFVSSPHPNQLSRQLSILLNGSRQLVLMDKEAGT